MELKNYDELNSTEIDTLREIGSIGTGTPATAHSPPPGPDIRTPLPEAPLRVSQSTM